MSVVFASNGWSDGRKIVLADDPDYRPDEGAFMRFRLTYEGPLYASQPDDCGFKGDRRGPNKHDIRKKLHPQLKRLWEITPFLKAGSGTGPDALITEETEEIDYRIETLSKVHSHYGWNFVPLISHSLKLFCGLDILFLRPEAPGSVIQSGDIDNRLKTLFDAFRVPLAGERYDERRPEHDEEPFFVLLEEDKLITKIAVETDQMLEPVNGKFNKSDVRLIITVNIRPYELHLGNLPFA